jgi:phosphotriesterase-related protein
MGFVRTVCGDIPSDTLGVTYMHEHLIIESEIVEKNFKHIWLPSVSDAVTELGYCHEAGVRTFVDCMPMGSGGNIEKLKLISEQTNVNIVAATGMHTEKYYANDSDYLSLDSEDLAQRFIHDINKGAQETKSRAGIIKIATQGTILSPLEVRLFTAAATAHKETGAPILTHCEQGAGALQQIDLLLRLDVPLHHVTISHTDKSGDASYIEEILKSGVYVEFDQALRQAKDENPQSAHLMKKMVEGGFIKQLMLGTDGARRTLWTAHNGTPGLAWMILRWSTVLRNFGLTADEISTIFVKNPSKALSFHAKI